MLSYSLNISLLSALLVVSFVYPGFKKIWYAFDTAGLPWYASISSPNKSVLAGRVLLNKGIRETRVFTVFSNLLSDDVSLTYGSVSSAICLPAVGVNLCGRTEYGIDNTAHRRVTA